MVLPSVSRAPDPILFMVPEAGRDQAPRDTRLARTIAFSGKGSSTDGIVTAYMKQYGLKAIPTATGGPAPTLTQVMSGQIDIGCRRLRSARPDRSETRFASSPPAMTPRSSRARPCGC